MASIAKRLAAQEEVGYTREREIWPLPHTATSTLAVAGGVDCMFHIHKAGGYAFPPVLYCPRCVIGVFG